MARLQLVGGERALPAAARQISAHYRRTEVCLGDDLLRGTPLAVARCYRLRASPLFPLRTGQRSETYAALLGTLCALAEGEGAVFQVLFVPVRGGWRAGFLRLASDPWDRARSPFVDLPNLPKRAEEKVSRPLFAVSLRLAASDPRLLERLEGAFLGQFESEENALEPLDDAYPVTAVRTRTSRSAGMVLNAAELAGLAHLPQPKALLAGSLALATVSAPAPELARRDILVPLGVNRHRGQASSVGISADWLTRHVGMFGTTGSGKTNLLKVTVSALVAGYGLAFLDPAGDAAEESLRLVPKHRMQDVIYFDPTDRDWPPALNMLEYTGERERDLLASDLVMGLSRLFADAWGARLEWLLRQTVNTLLASRGEKTLRDIVRLLCDAAYREQVLSAVADPDLQGFWRNVFPRLERQAVDPVLNKVSRFVDNPLVRNIIAQPNRIDFHHVLREGKVLICNLSKGELGEEVSGILGSFILSRLYIAALARAQIPPQQRRLFTVIVDEFHNYAGQGMETSSIRSFFAEARKYRVALVAATQFPSQLDREVLKAMLGNAGTLICLRTGIVDARLLQQELGEFGLQELLDLDVGHALVRMGGAGSAFNLAIPEVRPPATSFHEEIVRRSRERYGRPRHEVEESLRRGTQTAEETAIALAVALEPDERLLLEQVVGDPERTVTAVAAALGFSGYRAARVRRQLQQRELVMEVTTRLGRGGTVAKFVVPTLKGYRALGQEPPPGRGGAVHRHFQGVIAAWSQRRGYVVSREHAISGGSVDVHLKNSQGAVAVELSVAFRPGREIENLRKCLAAGYPRVVGLFLDREARDAMKGLVAQNVPAEEQAKIRLGTLEEFASLL